MKLNVDQSIIDRDIKVAVIAFDLKLNCIVQPVMWLNLLEAKRRRTRASSMSLMRPYFCV